MGIIIVLAVGAWFMISRRNGGSASEPPTIDQSAVAVLPFRVGGADPKVSYLHEGMSDLLSVKFTGGGGLRAVSVQNVLRAVEAMNEDEVDSPELLRNLGTNLGVGQIIHGSVVGEVERLIIHATLIDVSTGQVVARSNIDGTLSTLPSMIDQLVSQLLSIRAGADDARLESLMSHSLPAIREYLDGRAAYRRGQIDPAVAHFSKAIELDTTFALAGLGLMESRGWSLTAGGSDRIADLIMTSRHRLSTGDRLFVEAFFQQRSVGDGLEAWARATDAQPYRANVWYRRGDAHFHYGPLVEEDNHLVQAERHFLRSVEVDDSFGPSIAHLIHLYSVRGDTSILRLFSEHFPKDDSVNGLNAYIRWRTSLAIGDTVAAARVIGDGNHLDRSAIANLLIGGTASGTTYGLDTVARGADLERMDAESRTGTQFGIHNYFMNRGRPLEARQVLNNIRPPDHDPQFRTRQLVLNNLFWDAEYEIQESGISELSSRLSATLQPGRAMFYRSTTEASPHLLNACTHDVWSTAHGNAPGSIPLRTVLERLTRPTSADTSLVVVCDLLVAALHNRDSGHLEFVDSLEELDSTLQEGPPGRLVRQMGNLLLARMYLELGRNESALRVSRRRAYYQPHHQFLSAYLAVEGEAAFNLGLKEEARKALGHYLGLRSDPEPGLEAERDRLETLYLQTNSAE